MRRIALTVLGLGLLVSVAPAEGEGEVKNLDPLASIQGSEFLAHVKWLSDDARGGRLTGTADERAATKYVADKFAEWGLKPAGEDGTFFQLFKAPSRAAMGEANTLRVGERALKAGTEFRPFGQSPKLQASGRLVFAGYGFSDAVYDDYEGLDATGAIVVAIRVTPDGRPPGVQPPRMGFFAQNLLTQQQIKSAENAGAAGLILIPAPNETDAVGRVSGGGRMARMMRTQPPSIPVAIATRAALSELFSAAGIDLAAWVQTTRDTRAPAARAALNVDATLATEIVSKEYQGRNVIGLIEGSDPNLKNQYVVIGAHADHVGRNEAGNALDRNNEIHNGADDNASGTAGMLELAQAFATCAFKPARSMLFMAYSGEELGLLGSRHWCNKPTRPIADVVAMINLDMIGRSVNGKCTAEGTESCKAFQPMVKKHNESVGLDVRFTKGVRGDSDHASFYRAKVPVIFFFTGLHKDYHRATDDWEKINFADAEKLLRLAYLCAAEMTATAERPAYNQVSAPARQPGGRPRRGSRARLGIHPAYDFEGSGVKVDQVSGKPAREAGMQDGDIIVQIGERQVTNMQDLMVALGAHKPGEKAKLIVVRGEKKERKELTVTFGG